MNKDIFDNDNQITNQTNHNIQTSNLQQDIVSIKSKSTSTSQSVKTEDLINNYTKDGNKVYTVLSYATSCEEHNQISLILPLKKTTGKLTLFIILNIFTVGIINLLIAWFPKLNLYLKYSITTLEDATHFGIFSKEDKEFEVVKKKLIDLPPIDYDSELSVVKKFNLNIEHGALQVIVFEYKVFNYIYIPFKDNFETISYQIKAPQSMVVENYSAGLNPNEVLYMKKIFGVCDIDIKINSCGAILFDELTDPFYLFQLYSVILWYCTNYYYYASVIVILAVISLVLSVYGTYTNLKKIQEISRYSCPVKVYRRNENNEFMEGVEINSTELVPGDMFEIPEDGLALPCDTILISGSVIVNESMLTGESTPVIKARMTSTDDIYDTNDPDYEKYILFAGTKIVQKRRMGNTEPAGIVFRTGFNTFKGNLIGGILYPKKDKDTFTRDSVKYIIIMCIMTVVGFLISLKFLIVEGDLTTTEIIERFLDLFTTAVPPSLPACLSIGITYSLSRLKDKGIFCIQRDRVNKAGSVNILVFDKTGTLTEDHLDINGFVSVRMNKNKQFEFNNFTDSCLNDSNIVIEHFKNKSPNNKNINKDLLQYYVECLACCHCLTYVKEKLLGDPIDVKMFESTEWIMKENTNTGNEVNLNPLVLDYIRPKCEEDITVPFSDDNNIEERLKKRYEIAIVKRFDFSSKLQRMTIIGKNLNENHFKAYCKGSPEKIRGLCNPSTLPEDFDDVLNSFTIKGFRVLGMAAKSINMNFQQSQTVTREFVESNMIFLGLLIVQNKLKEKTKESLAKYDAADLRMLMATGDNILTAICVSKDCNLIRQNKEMISCEIEEENGREVLKWNLLENEEQEEINNNKEMESSIAPIMNENDLMKGNNIIDTTSLLENTSNNIDDLYPPENINNQVVHQEEVPKIVKKKYSNILKEENPNLKNYYSTTSFRSKDYVAPLEINEKDFPEHFCKDDTFGIAITGPTFERLSKLNEKYLSDKDPLLLTAHDAFRLVLKNGRVFARMAPEHKALLVDNLKKEGFTTLMCGDGANDCSALRTAHVSVSLSPEEASIAAHFTSKEPDVSCIYELLREGKCSLTTSIQTFKYMMLYSMIQFFCVTLMMIYQTYLTDFQFLVSDLFIIFPLEWFLAMTRPYHTLTYHYPVSALISFPVLSSILAHSAIVFIFQFFGYRILKNHYGWSNICDFTDDDTPLPCHENTIFFLISLFQYLALAIAFFVSKPFRQRIYTNWILMIYLAGVYFYSIWITINCDSWSRDLFDLYKLEYYGDDDEEEEEEEENEEENDEQNEDELGDNEEEDELKENEEELKYIEEEEEGDNNGEDEDDDLIPGGKKIKYWILLIAGINTIINIFFEWVIMKLINNCYEINQIKRYKREIENYKLLKQNPNSNPEEIKDVEIYKYHRVYYYDRRQARKLNKV